MKVYPLFSSSSGNCTIIETHNTQIMIDAGVSYKQIEEAFESTLELDGLFITHDHGDHIASAGIVGRKQNCPIYLLESSFNEKASLFKNCITNFIIGGDLITLGDFTIKAFSTRHDTPSLGFTIQNNINNKKLGYLTDTGVMTKLVKQELQGCNAYILESDYDEILLDKTEEYDDFLKNRIRGPYGHLSNQEIINYLKTLPLTDIDWIALGHLSKRTNSPETLFEHLRNNFSNDILTKINIIKQSLNLSLE